MTAGQPQFEVAQARGRMLRKPGLGWLREFDDLPRYMQPGESAVMLASVKHDNLALLCLTDRRLLLVSELLDPKFREWDRSLVAGARAESGFLSSRCSVFFTDGPKVEFKDMDRREAQLLARELTRLENDDAE